MIPMLQQHAARLTHRDVRQRRRAVRKLFELDDPAALVHFQPLLESDDGWTNGKAADAYRRWFGPEHEALGDQLVVDSRSEVRLMAAEILPRLGEAARSHLSTLVESAESDVRLQAYTGLVAISSDNLLPVLEQAAVDEHHSVRRMAALRAHALEKERANELLSNALKDGHHRVRGGALESIGSLSDVNSFRDLLLLVIEDRRPLLRAEAARLLLPLDWERDDRAILLDLLSDPDGEMARVITAILRERDWMAHSEVITAARESQAPTLLARLLRGDSSESATILRTELLNDDSCERMLHLRLLEQLHGKRCTAGELDAAEQLADSDDELLSQAANSLLEDVAARS
jgi:HEAT repeat protein